MSLTPEYGEEGFMATEEGVFEAEVGVVEDKGSDEEGELGEHNRAEREIQYLDAEDNELHAPGQVCARCHQNINAGQDVRRQVDGSWVHEVCPPNLGGVPIVEG